jgi:hypothetical protein
MSFIPCAIGNSCGHVVTVARLGLEGASDPLAPMITT